MNTSEYSCIQGWVGAKLQKAGYQQKAVKWDSDSDSDETDEEDLAV